MKYSSRVIFVGDVHGHILALNTKARLHPDNLHFQIGDMGFGFFKEIKLEPNIRFFRGNHDSPEKAKLSPGYMGDYGLVEGPNRSFYFICGGASIDYAQRVPGMSWWWDEELDTPTLDRVINEVLAKRPQIIVSHECPASIIPHVGLMSNHFSFPPSRTAIALQRIFERYQPAMWIFGHHHVSWSQTINDTKFICLRELQALPVEL